MPSLQAPPLPIILCLQLLLLRMMLYGMGYPFGHLESAVLVPSPPSSSWTFNLLTIRTVWEAEMCLALYNYCSATTRTSRCYHHFFHQKSKTLHQTSLCEEKLSLSQPRLWQNLNLSWPEVFENRMVELYLINFSWNTGLLNFLPLSFGWHNCELQNWIWVDNIEVRWHSSSWLFLYRLFLLSEK